MMKSKILLINENLILLLTHNWSDFSEKHQLIILKMLFEGIKLNNVINNLLYLILMYRYYFQA